MLSLSLVCDFFFFIFWWQLNYCVFFFKNFWSQRQSLSPRTREAKERERVRCELHPTNNNKILSFSLCQIRRKSSPRWKIKTHTHRHSPLCAVSWISNVKQRKREEILPQRRFQIYPCTCTTVWDTHTHKLSNKLKRQSSLSQSHRYLYISPCFFFHQQPKTKKITKNKILFSFLF